MPQKYKGGKNEAQKRYRKKNRDAINERKRTEYQNNKEKHHKRASDYRKNHREIVYIANSKWQRGERRRCRILVIAGYGGECKCCGEKELHFLEIHHPNGDGKADRERTGGNYLTLYKWIIKNNYPGGYDLLCANCHRGIHRSEDGICPHKKNTHYYSNPK